MSTSNIPVIAIDGPTASGKGTVAHRVADKLGFHYLDSGALYRLTALMALRRGTDLRDEHALAKLAEHLPCHFAGGEILLAQENVTEQIRAEEVGNTASKIAVCQRCAMRWWACSWVFARRRAWWPTGATWAR